MPSYRHRPASWEGRDGGMESDRDPERYYNRFRTDEQRARLEGPVYVPVRVSLDCGQVNDASALSVVETEWRGDIEHYIARSLQRLPLGTPYPQVADRVSEVVKNIARLSDRRISQGQPGLDPMLVLDAGGVGRGVADLLEERDLIPVRITITGGDGLRRTDTGEYRVAKATLVSSLLILIQSGRLHLPSDAQDTGAMIEELRAFRVDVSKSGNETYGAKTGQHDDLLMSLAMATLPGLRLPNDGQSWLAFRAAPGRW